VSRYFAVGEDVFFFLPVTRLCHFHQNIRRVTSSRSTRL